MLGSEVGERGPSFTTFNRLCRRCNSPACSEFHNHGLAETAGHPYAGAVAGKHFPHAKLKRQ